MFYCTLFCIVSIWLDADLWRLFLQRSDIMKCLSKCVEIINYIKRMLVSSDGYTYIHTTLLDELSFKGCDSNLGSE